MTKHIPALCVITDTHIQSRFSHLKLAEQALKGGAKMLQFRDKYLSDEAFQQIATELKLLCNAFEATLIINDRVHIAKSVNSDGVHIGQQDMPIQDARKVLGSNKIIGVSTSTLEEAQKAYHAGADYIGFGHIFLTSTKHKLGASLGPEMIKSVKNISPVPVMAIGGITLENAHSVFESGADSIAVVSAICTAKNPKKATESFIQITK